MTLSWAFEGGSTPFTVAVPKSLETVHAIAPPQALATVAVLCAAPGVLLTIQTLAQEHLDISLLPDPLAGRLSAGAVEVPGPDAKHYLL